MCIGCSYRISTGEPYIEYIFCPEILNPEPDTSLYKLKWEPVKCNREGLKAKRLPLKAPRFDYLRKWLRLTKKEFSLLGERELKRLFEEYGKKSLNLQTLFSIKHPASTQVRYFRQMRFQKGFVLVGNNFSTTDMGILKLSGNPGALANVLDGIYSNQEIREEESGNADAIADALANEGILKLNRMGFAAYPKSGQGVFGSGKETFAKAVRRALGITGTG